jgi:signal transduction histidine kinase/CheY-like chemotaxis protein
LELPEVVLVTPNETDALAAVRFLADAGLRSRACATLATLSDVPLDAIGCLVLVEEALTKSEVEAFRHVLSAQPPWSDLPLVLIATEGTPLGALVESLFPESGNVAVLARPLNPVSLVSAVRVGLRARQKQLEVRDLLEQRQTAVRRRDEFLAMLAHELRNPLAPLRNAVYLMRQPQITPELFARTRDLIDRQTTHLKRLVDDLLDVSRLELGKIRLQMQPLDLSAAVRAATETCTPALSARGHALRLELAEEPLPIVGDPVRIEQVVCNLVTNAIKFTPEGGHISVVTRVEGADAALIVRDDGVGIEPRLLGSVFDLFMQDDKTLERSGGGLGIGLTIVKRLVEMHGGSISVDSGGAGQGSRFTVLFPRAKAQRPATPRVPVAEPAVSPKRVLVVEDNADIRESLGLILGIWGHHVEFAETGPAGLDRAFEMQPDVALIDIGLPGLSGYDLARRIRNGGDSGWSRNVQLVALTGYGRDSDRDKALEAGFDCHLVKPVDPAVLQKTLG